MTQLSMSEYLPFPPALLLLESEDKGKENPEEEEMGKTSPKQEVMGSNELVAGNAPNRENS